MSDNHRVYLRPDVQMEPLFNGWYAWPQLIPPHTAAMHMANRHVKIMRSYIAAPDVHASAVKNPAMRGGPFLDYDGKRVSETKSLLEQTIKGQGHLMNFAEAVRGLDALLTNEARGHTLEPLYPRIPEALRGFVELVYDLNNNPSARFLEGLLYTSSYYDPGLQTISLSLTNGDDRAFAFSTPRLEDSEHLHVKMPFNSGNIDELFKAREIPQSVGLLRETLGLADRRDELFRSFLSDQEPVKVSRYNGEHVRVRYFGHACILVESKDVSLLTDPVISYSYNTECHRYTYMDLPQVIDYVLITHSHTDHLLFESLLQLRHKVRNIVIPRSAGGTMADPSLRLILKNIGFENVIEIDEMEPINIDGGSVTGIPFFGEHADLNTRSKTAYLIQVGGISIVCAADSCNLETRLYELVHQQTGDIDVLFLGMECDGAPLSWIYGPLLTKALDRKMDQSRRLSGSDFPRAQEMIDRLRCKQVYVYAMGQEPWLGYITSIKYTDESKPIVESNKLLDACVSRGIQAERLYGSKEMFLGANR